MVEIEKIKGSTDKNYFFQINLDEGKFIIYFSSNGDLYWNYQASLFEIENCDEKSFRITKENYYLYLAIEELYEKIKSYNSNSNGYINNDLRRIFRKRNKNNKEKLFKYGRVDWHSDDYTYEESSRLLIEKDKEEFIITFVKGIDYLKHQTFAIRFSNSNSRYNPSNLYFMNMYCKLIKYNPEFHQIHIEEYLYEMKLTRQKKELTDNE